MNWRSLLLGYAGLALAAGPVSGFLLMRAIQSGYRRDYPAAFAWGTALGAFNVLCYGAAAWMLRGAL